MDVGVGMMQVEVTNRCNLNCPHCFYYEAGEKGEDYNNFLNLKAMDKLLNDLGIRYIRTLNFTGGEPLLNTESVFLQAKLESDCEFESNIWGEPNPLDIFIEEAV